MRNILVSVVAVLGAMVPLQVQAAPSYVFKRAVPALSVQPSQAALPTEPNASEPYPEEASNGLVLQPGGYRTWANGATAPSCLEYLQPSSGQVYTGDTGDGLYQVLPSGQAATTVYCDMTRDGGGWTLVMKAPAGAPNRSSWSTPGALYVENLQNATVLGGAAKYSDAFINTLKTQAFKLEGSIPGASPVRYVKPSCVYAHTAPATGDCLKTYSSPAWAGERVGGYGAAAWGIHDAIVSGGYATVFFQFNDSRSPDWYVGNGVGVSYGTDYRNSAAASVLMWVR